MSGPWENLPPRPTPPQPAGRGPSRHGWLLWLGGLAALGLMVFALERWFPGGRDSANAVDAVYLMVLLGMLSSGVLYARKTDWLRALRYIAIWLPIAALLIVGFAFQEPLKQAMLNLCAQILPGYAVATGERELAIAESEGGHYLVYGMVNGAQVRFLVDTGASGIVLSRDDARKAGIAVDDLRFDIPVGTANGVGYSASVTLDRLEVGAIHFTNVRASVQQAEIGTSLLGMDFLRRLKSYGVQDRRLILRW